MLVNDVGMLRHRCMAQISLFPEANHLLAQTLILTLGYLSFNLFHNVFDVSLFGYSVSRYSAFVGA